MSRRVIGRRHLGTLRRLPLTDQAHVTLVRRRALLRTDEGRHGQPLALGCTCTPRLIDQATQLAHGQGSVATR